MLLIEFVANTRLAREPDFVPKLPIVQNGPPGTVVSFAEGHKVPLPTDQIVWSDDTAGAASVRFGGMSFVGLEAGQLVFKRVRDLRPDAELSPHRGRRMTLELAMVASIHEDDVQVWPTAPSVTK